jgi:hypothetical protein
MSRHRFCIELLDYLIGKLERLRDEYVFVCRYCGRGVDFTKRYRSDERGLWHWDCPRPHVSTVMS